MRICCGHQLICTLWYIVHNRQRFLCMQSLNIQVSTSAQAPRSSNDGSSADAGSNSAGNTSSPQQATSGRDSMSPGAQSSGESGESGYNTAAIIAAVIIGVAVCTSGLVAVCLVIIVRRRRATQQEIEKRDVRTHKILKEYMYIILWKLF